MSEAAFLPSYSPITLRSGGSILERTDRQFENQAVLNPACVTRDGVTHMFYRAVRQGNFSTIGYCQLVNNEVVYRASEPVIAPEFDYESQGVEDPRIVECDGLFYLMYTAFDGMNAQIAYAVSEDLVRFEKRGIISAPLLYSEAAELCRDHKTNVYEFYRKNYHPREDLRDMLLYEKDALLFPKKIHGKFALVHRIFPAAQIIYFDDFAELTHEFWSANLRDLDNHTIIEPTHWFESQHVGGGCPPIETAAGWLFIYHAVEQTESGRTYHAAAALLDLDDPTKVIGQLAYPLFSPNEDWELKGDVNNVVFPSGAVVEDGELHIYYGAADSCIGYKSVQVDELLQALQPEG